jgi:hypothetical protein
MKKFLSFAAIGLFVASMSSCTKCYDCEWEFLGTTTSQEFCSGDGVSNSELDDIVAAYEALGYECTEN